jgi:hypothetical protein
VVDDLVGGQEGAFMLGVTGLTAPFLARGRLGGSGLGRGRVGGRGFEEFEEFGFTRASSSATRTVSRRICSAGQAIRETTVGGSDARTSGDKAVGASIFTFRDFLLLSQ